MIHTFRPRTDFERNFPSDKATEPRYRLMKSERIEHCKVKSELLLWTALKRPLHTICQEHRRLHCRKLPQRGAREHSSQPPWKKGGKCNNTQRPFFPPSTEEGCSIQSDHTHSSHSMKDEHTKSLTLLLHVHTFYWLKSLCFLSTLLLGSSCWRGKAALRSSHQ